MDIVMYGPVPEKDARAWKADVMNNFGKLIALSILIIIVGILINSFYESPFGFFIILVGAVFLIGNVVMRFSYGDLNAK
jgi:hypothetical protein